MKTLRVLAIALTMFVGAHAQEVPSQDPSKFLRLDQNQQLAAQLGFDSISKWIVVTADPNDTASMIGPRMLEGVIAEMVTEGGLPELISGDLAKGDDLLRAAMGKLLYIYNYPENQSAGMLNKWATSGPDQALVTILNNAAERGEALAVLRDYLVKTTSDWVRAVYMMDSILNGSSRIPLETLRQALINSGGVNVRTINELIDGAKSHGGREKWTLASPMLRILEANGSLGRAIKAEILPEGSFYAKVWGRFARKIAGDPLLMKEYAARSAGAAEIYQTIRGIMCRSLLSGTDRFGDAFIKGAKIPGSRFEWIVEQALFDQGGIRSTRGMGQTAGAARIGPAIAQNCAASVPWSDLMLWHLTRPAEALALTTRLSLPTVLGSDEELAKRLARRGMVFGSNFESLLNATDAYHFYSGGAAEFRTRLSNNDIERRALLQYGTAVGNLLANNDDAWAYALEIVNSPTEQARQGDFATILAASIEKDSTVANAWAKTLVDNDANLLNGFTTWIRSSGKQQDRGTTTRWLESVNTAFRTGTVLGNVDVANFKVWLGEYIQSPDGWAATNLRFNVEGIGIPFELRRLMINEALSNPEVFWRLYALICRTSGFTVSTIKPKMIGYANQTGMAKALLDEIIAQNQLASDAVDPMYDTLLAPDSAVIDALAKNLADGVTLSNTFSLNLLALKTLAEEDANWVRIRPLAASHFGGADPNDPTLRDKFNAEIASQSANALPLYKRIIADKQLKEEWRKAIVHSVRYSGKGYIVATLIRRDYQLSALWAKTLAGVITEEPLIVKNMVESLSARRVGDPRWAATVKNMHVQLAQLIFNDRVFFEQITADHNESFRKDLRMTISGILGGATAKTWIP